MYGYIVPDVVQKDMKAVKKYNDKSKITFGLEVDSTPERFEANPIVTPDGRSRESLGGAKLSNPSISFPNQPSPPANISLSSLPTTDPGIEGVIWNDGGIPKVSTG